MARLVPQCIGAHPACLALLGACRPVLQKLAFVRVNPYF
ncbi:MAG: hypothetical protein ACD_10C00495G0004, partial [uncultured bacterium]